MFVIAAVSKQTPKKESFNYLTWLGYYLAIFLPDAWTRIIFPILGSILANGSQP